MKNSIYKQVLALLFVGSLLTGGWIRGCSCRRRPTGVIHYPTSVMYYCNAGFCNYAMPKFSGIVTDSSSDSDFELPHIPFPKKHRTITATSEGDLMSTDNNDGLKLNNVTPPILQDTTGSSAPGPVNIVHLPDIEDMPGSSSQITFNDVHLPDMQDMPGSSSQVLQDLNPSMTMAMASNPNTTMVMAVSPPTTHLVQAGTPQVEMKIERRCILCYDRFPNAFYYPCGHTSCLVCALHLQQNGGRCPHYRREIGKVRSIFNDFED